MDLGILEGILILLGISLLMAVIMQKMRMPSIVGFIVAGILLGPHVMGLVSERTDIHGLAEFGLVFLMFTIGLEFSWPRLIQRKIEVFGYGGLQVTLSIFITTLVGILLNMSLSESLIVGAVVAMSSTAVVLKQLKDQLEFTLPHGQNALGILLFQDLAVIPTLILLQQLGDITLAAFSYEMAYALIKGVFAIGLIIILGRYVLKPLYYLIASAYSFELFTLLTVFITLGAAWFTAWLGLSLTLGAFFAGLMLGETEFRHQIESDIRPLRDVLMGVFFLTIGMQLNLMVLQDAWIWMLLLLLALFMFKTVLIFGLGRLFKHDNLTASRTALTLANGGEFGFAIIILANDHRLLPEDYTQVMLGAILLSMILAPIIIKYQYRLTEKFFSPKEDKSPLLLDETDSLGRLKQHVMICGYGRVGQSIARFLEKVNIPYLAFDLDPGRVKNAQLAGDRVCYADATQIENMLAANLRSAQAVVVTFNHLPATLKVLEQVRAKFKHIPILARVQDDEDAQVLYGHGATEVVPEVLETAMMLASHALLMIGVAPQIVDKLIDENRVNRYDLLRQVFPSENMLTTDPNEKIKEGLHVIMLSKGAKAIDHALSDIPLSEVKGKVTAIRRRHQRIIDPSPNFVLREGDVVVLYGLYSDYEHTSKLLLSGKLV